MMHHSCIINQQNATFSEIVFYWMVLFYFFSTFSGHLADSDRFALSRVIMLKVISSVLAHIGPDSEYTWARLIHSALRAPTYHLYFELFLILGIIWLLFKRRYRINDTIQLTSAEKAQLIREWTPDDLVPKDWIAPKNLLRQFHRCATGPVSKYVYTFINFHCFMMSLPRNLSKMLLLRSFPLVVKRRLLSSHSLALK